MTEGQPALPARPQLPPDMIEFNRQLIDEHRASGARLSGRWAGRSLLLLTTTGARSGRPRTVVLAFGTLDGRPVVIASNNGAPAHPAWYVNLQAEPVAIVELGPDRVEARARTASGEERERAAATVPWYESQQQLTSREIPIVILEPIDRSVSTEGRGSLV